MPSREKRFDFRKFLPGLFYAVVFCFICCLNQNADAAMPSPWLNQDIGSASNGSADFANNQFTVSGAGINIGSLSDTFHYVYQLYTGDVEIIAKVESIGNIDVNAKAGVMIRETLTNKSKNVLMTLTSGSTSFLTRRTSTNGSTTSTAGTNVRAPYWVKLVRRGNNFYGYQSTDGNSWTQIGGVIANTMTANVYVGLAANSGKAATYNTSVFSNVSVKPAVPPSAPVLSSATSGVAQVDLSWNASSTATSYKVKYGTVSGSYTTTLNLGNVTSTSVTGLSNGTAYYFVVTAVNDYGESVVSNQMSATPLDPPMVFIKKIDYNAMGQKTRIEYGNGVVTTNTYDSLNLRLKRIYSVNVSSQALQDLSYTYDSAGNILSITDGLNTASQTFQYDALNRLTQANGTSYGVKNYQYDPIGNIVQKDGKIYSYAEGGAGVHAVTSLSDGTTMTYDANGNMASKQKGSELTLFLYDAENRLLELKKNGVTTAKYEYDGDGGRVKKTVGSTVTRYVGSLYEETNGVKTRHIFVGDLKVASITGANQMFYHTDHLGGTNVLTDKVGVKKELIEYEPYGTFARHDKYGTGAEVANFYFTGQRFDEESGLYYYGARYYDSGLGRFLTADSVVEDPTNSQTLNRYSYVQNNPINLIDPTGHWSWKKFWNSFSGAVVGVAVAVLLGPAGFAAFGATMAGAIGGAMGGAITGGLNGGWQGALMGVGMGGVLGGVGGWGIAKYGGGFGVGMLAAGAGVAGATDSWDSFAGGIAGGIVGSSLANGFLSAKYDSLREQNPTEGIREGVSAEENENWAFLGIGTTEGKAITFANENQISVIYTKSRGILADLFRAGFKKIGVKGSYAQQTANYLNVAEGKFILAHSEGTLNLGVGIKLAATNGVKFQNLELKWIGPVVSRFTATNLANSIGAQSKYYLNLGDPIGALTTNNPISLGVYGSLGMATMTFFHDANRYVR